jgi:hypothetical protein
MTCCRTGAQIVKKVEAESQRSGRKRRNLLADLRREVAIMRELRHKNIVTLQARARPEPFECRPRLLTLRIYMWA